MENQAPAKTQFAGRWAAVSHQVWIWSCILFPLATLISIAAANILLVVIIAGGLTFRASLPLHKTRTLLALAGLYLLWSFLASALAPFPALWGVWLERRSTLLAIIPGLIVGADIRRLGQAYRYVTVLLFIEAWYAAVQYFWGWDLVRQRPLKILFDHYHATGLQNFHLTFAGMIALALPASLAVGSKSRMKTGLLSLAGAVSVVVSMARSMMLGLIGGGALLAVLGSRRLKLAGITLILALIILSGTIFNASGQRMLFGLGLARTHQEQGDPTRLYLWKSALNIIQAYPIAGVGTNGWKPAFELHKVPYDLYSTTAHAHNDFLASAVEGGLIGAAIFVLLWGYIIIKGGLAIWRVQGEARDLRLGFWVALLALLFGGLFQCYQSDAENALLLWFTVGVSIQLSASELKSKN
jgi:O-antigen ligase